MKRRHIQPAPREACCKKTSNAGIEEKFTITMDVKISQHCGEQYCAQREATLQGPDALHHQLPLPDFENELMPLWRSGAVDGPGGMERVAKVISWYNDHQRSQICALPRAVQLFDDPLEWRALLTRAWIDLVDQEVDVHFFVVSPRPLSEAEDVVGSCDLDSETTGRLQIDPHCGL